MIRVWAAGRFNDGARFIIPFVNHSEARAWIADKRVAARLFTVYSNFRPRDRLTLDEPLPSRVERVTF